MTNPQEKTKRLVVGAVVAGVLLFVFLLVVIIIQTVQISVRNADIKRIEEEITSLQAQIADGQKDYNYYSSIEGLEKLAFGMGYTIVGGK